MPEQISYDDFAKLDIRIGLVVAAELVPETDKLIKCTVDFGEMGNAPSCPASHNGKNRKNLVGKRLAVHRESRAAEFCGAWKARECF